MYVNDQEVFMIAALEEPNRILETLYVEGHQIDNSKALQAKWRRGCKKDPRIKDERIKGLYEQGLLPTRIKEALFKEDNINCALQTVLNRINAMKKQGSLR